MAERRPRVGLLGLMLELYDTLAPQLRADRENWVRASLLPALAPAADVEFRRAVASAADIRAEIGHFVEAKVDAVLVVCLSYSPSLNTAEPLARCGLPVIVWNTQELWAVDENYGPAELTANHGVHGTQDLCSVLTRMGAAFEYVTSHVRDGRATSELGRFFNAAAAATDLRRLRVGLLGYAFPGMGDFAIEPSRFTATLGPTVCPLTVDEYIRRAASAAESDVQAMVDDYRRSYDLAVDLAPADLDATARAELALRGMVADNKLDAITYQFLAFGEDERTETVPFVAASRMMSEGVGFGGEGDVIGAAGAWLLHRLCPPATFSEIFTIDFAGNSLLMSHMGEANVAMIEQGRKANMVARPSPITRTRKRQLALRWSFRPGPATLFALVQGPGGRWRFIVSKVGIVPFEPRPTLAVPQFKILPAPGDVRGWLTRYAKAGGPHHNAVCLGDAREQLLAVARLVGAELVEV
ncbi:MAG: hypothetical protein HZA50_08095 [Planctomycetes bacterium]|nr:hypothetical protein [Planctomycetota bacterium]